MKTFEVISEERLKALFQIEGHATCNWLHDLIENCISELKCLALKWTLILRINWLEFRFLNNYP